MSLLDARGVPIDAGDTVIYGFGVGRSVAMAEAVVLGEAGLAVSPDASPDERFEETLIPTQKVSLTPSGRVRLRVVRRSYFSGTKPVVDVAADRLVVLKPERHPADGEPVAYLPPSPLPTQDEKARADIERAIERYKAALRSTEITWGHESSFATLAEFHAYAAKRLEELRAKLRELDE